MLLFFLLPSVALATGGLLANAAIEKTVIAVDTKANPSSLDATVENIAKETGVEVKEDVLDLVKNMMTQDLNPKTMKSMLENLVGEVPQDKKDEYATFASKLTGLYTKKSKLVKEMVQTFANGTADAKKIRESMKNLNVNSIVKEVNRTFGGQKEWNRIKNFIQEINVGSEKVAAKEDDQPVGIQIEEARNKIIECEVGIQDEPQVDPIMPEDHEQTQVEGIPPTALVDPVGPHPLTLPQIDPMPQQEEPIKSDNVLGDPVPLSSHSTGPVAATLQIAPVHL